MEFDQLQKIWDTQTNKPLYAIDETALHHRISSKKNKGLKITNISELLSIVVNVAGGVVILRLNLMKAEPNVALYLLSAWMVAVAGYCLVSRMRRLALNNRFDRSLQGDLRHALSVATYQVRFSQFIRWNSLPIAVLLCIGLWESGKSIWLGVITSLFVLVANYVGGWEHNIYKARKTELEKLTRKLEADFH